MTIIYKISNFLKKKLISFSNIDSKAFRIQKISPIILVTFLIIFSIIFFISSNLINKKNQENVDNFKAITKTNEF